MEKSNLISILKTFDKKEVREFRKWLHSPAHNQRQDVIDLYEYLMAGQHLFVEKFLEKERAFCAVFFDKTYNDNEMRQCMHFLFKAVEDFLAYNELLKDEVRIQTMLAKVYRQRQLPKLFNKAMDASKKTQQKQPFRNHQYFENEYALQFEQYSYLSGLDRNVPLNLQEVSDANDIAYLANKLQLSCFMIAHQKVFKADYNTRFLDGVLRYLEKENPFLQIPAIAIYYYGYKAMTNKDDDESYRKLKEQILRHQDIFPQQENRITLLMANNYCISQTNTGKEDYFRESFELYDIGMKKKIFLQNGVLSRFTFGNAISIALNLKEFEWVENLIANNSHQLEEKHRENYVLFYRARLHFERKEYKKAMRLFAQFEYDDILMSLHAKTMLLKMYYELDEFSALDSLLGSMQTYLQRKKIMGYHKTNYKNIIKTTKRLLKIFPNDREKKGNLKKEITETNPLTEKKWLLEQLDKL